MLSTVTSCGRQGIEGYPMRVEVDVRDGLPMVDVVGLPDAAVRESRERVRTALRNSGFPFPVAQITINLAPADIKKEGPWYDLPIALGILAASGRIPQERLRGALALGTLSLDGSLAPVTGALPMLLAARRAGIERALLPAQNARECACLSGIALYPVESLRQAAAFLCGEAEIAPLTPVRYADLAEDVRPEVDLASVRGQYAARRALEIAASGGHNLLLIGTAGSGKTMLARCLPGILPRMTEQEALETTVIHSVSGEVSGGLMTRRPFSAPHHTTSAVALIGGGRAAAPGEISKAHNGVLFLDELPEFPRAVLEALRQPMEDGVVTISRVNARCVYPARFQLVCAMNPCPCGNYGSRTRTCRCTPHEVQRYLSRISARCSTASTWWWRWTPWSRTRCLALRPPPRRTARPCAAASSACARRRTRAMRARTSSATRACPPTAWRRSATRPRTRGTRSPCACGACSSPCAAMRACCALPAPSRTWPGRRACRRSTWPRRLPIGERTKNIGSRGAP